MPFGLKYFIARDHAQLAYYPVCRADIIRVSDRSRFRKQRAGKKIVKGPVTLYVRVDRFLHVHAIVLDEPADNESRKTPGISIGDLPRQCGHGPLWHQVLRKHGERWT